MTATPNPTVSEILQTMDYGPAPEANGPVLAWLAQHKNNFGHYIAGKFVSGQGDKKLPALNPSTDEVLAQVACGTAQDIDAAVAAAKAAQSPWVKLRGHGRARYLYAIARLIQKRERFLSVLETMNNGKPIRESRDIDIPLVARHFYYHAGWAELVESEFPDYQSLGVCGQIVPWNFPLLMLAWKIAPALATGNTVVLKPAEFTPLTALAFAEICHEAGLPAGVVNIVCGDGSTGEALVAHEAVDKIAFTGSTEVGRLIRRSTAGTGKKLSLELGGKSPFIVYEDADVDAAIEGVVDAIWFNQGQVCCAGSRLLLAEAIAPQFIERLKQRMQKLRVGSPLDKSIDMGAIIAPVQLQRIKALVATGVSQGNNLYQPLTQLPEGGSFYPPSLFTDAQPASEISQEEIFGPVAVTMTFRTPDEAIQLANHTRYGLAASIWTENIDTALDAAARIKAGVVWINATNLFDAAAGFGGYKESGFGREGGREGLYEYLQNKHFIDLPQLEEQKLNPQLTSAKENLNTDIDRTAKLFIGGKQCRPDSGYSFAVIDAKGRSLGLSAQGSRKDIRNAVEAAVKASAWSSASAHNRAQVIYYIAENLSARADEFAKRLASTGASPSHSRREVETSLQRLFYYAAQADKFDGRVHSTKARHVTLAMHEPYGVMGIICPDEAPLLAMISLLAPALAMGNRVVLVPSQTQPLSATDFYQILETSDVPPGVVNIITGPKDELAKTLSEHDEVAALWYHGDQSGGAAVEKASAGNLKFTWTNHGSKLDWLTAKQAQGPDYLRHATQVKNIWIPYGE